MIDKQLEEDLLKWELTKDQLALIKILEAEMKKGVCAKLFKGRVGKFSVKDTLSDGRKFQADSNIATNLDAAVYNQIFEDLTQAEKDCVNPKPTLKEGEYNKLMKLKAEMEKKEGKEFSLALESAITVKPAAPSLKLEKEE